MSVSSSQNGHCEVEETMPASPTAHEPAPARRVVGALLVTLAAAALEFAAARSGGSLFLTADAIHLVAHTAIYAILLVPHPARHGRREDIATIAILIVVGLIGLSITLESAQAFLDGPQAVPSPGVMLFSLAGLAANLLAGYFFWNPARRDCSFSAALAHELSDASLTVAGLVGALVVHLWAVRWIDPLLSLAIGVWLTGWALRRLARRARRGPTVWLDAA